MAKKQKKTYLGGRPRYTAPRSALENENTMFGKLDGFKQPEFVYDNKLGKMIKNPAWDKRKLQNFSFWPPVAETCFG